MKTVLEKKTLGQQVAEVLRQRIIEGTYAQGEALAEEALASEFDVSRATIREALRLLEFDGLLVREINKHTCVRKFTGKEIISIFAIRTMLEMQGLKYCLKHNCVPKEKLEKHLEHIYAARDTQLTTRYEALNGDIEFHLEIIRALDNPYITEFWTHLLSQYKMVIYYLRTINPNCFFITGDIHRNILDALLAGDMEPWLDHLTNAEQDVENLVNAIE